MTEKSVFADAVQFPFGRCWEKAIAATQAETAPTSGIVRARGQPYDCSAEAGHNLRRPWVGGAEEGLGKLKDEL